MNNSSCNTLAVGVGLKQNQNLYATEELAVQLFYREEIYNLLLSGQIVQDDMVLGL